MNKTHNHTFYVKPFVWFMLSCLVLLSLGVSGTPYAHAILAGRIVEVTPISNIILIPGTVVVDTEIESALVLALGRANSIIKDAKYFAVTDIREVESWYFVSTLGLVKYDNNRGWSFEDSVWVGMVLIERDQINTFQGAVEGTTLFSELLDEVPERIINGLSKNSIDPLRKNRTLFNTTSGYIFPWQSGTSMFYGSAGVHTNGFISGWKAVDMMSDGNTGAGHAPNRLLAAASGSIGYICRDSNNVAIRIDNLFYTHLVDNSNLQLGKWFNQGDEMGQMKSGTFGTTGVGCGWATQGSNWFHVHWGFPNADLQVEGWTLSMATQNWTKGSTTVSPNNWGLTAGGGNNCKSLPGGYNKCADEDGFCSFSGTKDVYYGANSCYYSKLLTDGTWCNNGVFGDPLYNVRKACYISDSGGNHSPNTPTLLSPPNGSTQNSTPQLCWQNNGDQDGDSVTFQASVWGTTNAQSNWIPDTCWTPSTLPVGNYTWNVRAKDEHGAESGATPDWTFNIETPPLPCYSLTRSRTGNGGDPTADPTNSSGCSSGQYHEGENITLTASPASGWSVGSWSGTNNNSSTAITNTKTMPSSDHTVTVNYTQNNIFTNDDFDYATDITNVPYSNNQDTTDASEAIDDPTFPDGCADADAPSGYHTVWYTFLSSSQGTLTIDTFESGFDTILGVWTGNRGSLYSVGCNDDSNNTQQSFVQLSTDTDQKYYIELAGYYPTSYGDLLLNVSFTSGNEYTKTFRSRGLYDGYILESGEYSNKGGSSDSTSISFILGDDWFKRQYRAILSFNTTVLPDDAVIKSALLKIKYKGMIGYNPLTTHVPLLVDISNPYFGSSIALSSSDFQAIASGGRAGTFGVIPISGWYSAQLNSSSFTYFNKIGSTQFRLRFKLDDDNDNNADQIMFFSGNYVTIAYRPMLIIKYNVP